MLNNIRKASLSIFLLYLTGMSTAMSNNDSKFEWLATESAPHHYPMKIIQGTFIYHGETEKGLYVPSGGTLYAGWGDGISNHVVGEKLKPLPDRLKIIFYSFAEKQFYSGEFALPYDKILELFHVGATRYVGRPGFDKLMVGVAPGGVVAVWYVGGKKTEVYFGQANKIDINPSQAFALPFKNKEQSDKYVKEVLEESLKPAELESLKKNGIPFGLWARYRNRYDWIPITRTGQALENVDVVYLNGESIKRWVLTGNNELTELRPVPRKISFHTILNGEDAIFIVRLDEFETMAAFEKLGASGIKVYLDFEPHGPGKQLKVRLRNDKESIELKKITREDRQP